MDIMVQDLERNGAVAKKVGPEPTRPKPREGSDMAEMLANIDNAKGQYSHASVQVGPNGTVALIEEPSLSLQSTGQVTPNKTGKTSRADDALSGGGVAVEGVEQAGSGAADIAEVVGEAVEQGTQMASQSVKALSSTAMDVAMQGASIASGALVVPLLYRGAKKLKEGIKEGDLDKKLEGGNSMAIGARSGATAVTLAGGGSSVVGQLASAAAPILGVGTAVVDGVLGVREIAKGKKTSGLLRIGFAASVGAAALGAGPIATLATGGFLAARVVRSIREVRQNQRAAKQG